MEVRMIVFPIHILYIGPIWLVCACLSQEQNDRNRHHDGIFEQPQHCISRAKESSRIANREVLTDECHQPIETASGHVEGRKSPIHHRSEARRA
ncbi:hypothetical protein F5X99DRAFT_338114 [Biscogniauxia marginata]|nr:hypothetical protein F5X99DRAFT_338114 [Biscogniauxia marginata]